MISFGVCVGTGIENHAHNYGESNYTIKDMMVA